MGYRRRRRGYSAGTASRIPGMGDVQDLRLKESHPGACYSAAIEELQPFTRPLTG